MSVLADRARMTKQSMTELVAHLERHGYVERVPDPADGRAKLVRATGRGREVYAVARCRSASTRGSVPSGWRPSAASWRRSGDELTPRVPATE